MNKLKKIISTIVMFGLFLPILASAEDAGNIDMVSSLQSIIKKHEETIKKLQEENDKLKSDLSKLKPTVVLINTGTLNIENSSNILTVKTKASSVEKYNKVVDKINLISTSIFSENNLATTSSIGLFEFIEPSSFFISIDDGANPVGVTAFKKKVLYSYDGYYNFKVDGIFELDYKTQYYITKFGSNPFAKAVRVKVKNPNYKGKLLETSTTVTTSTTSNTTGVKATTTATTTPVNTNVTIEMIKTAYNKNKVLDALKYSNDYIIKYPSNIEVLKIRYRSYYMLGKYSEALAEIQKIETILTSEKVEKLVVCDAKIISKLLKNTDANKKYTDLCNAKK